MTQTRSPEVELPPFSGIVRVTGRRPRPQYRRVPGTASVFLLGCVIGALASTYTVLHGTNLDYGDSMAHMTIAQRIVESRSPGLAQLGTVWLPVPHLLLLPLVQDEWLFHTGVAGCILGSLCLGASAAALWRIMSRLGLGTPARVVGLAVLFANPAYLYISTTALTEPVLIAGLLLCTAGLAGWAFSPRQLSGGELAVFAGIPAAAGVMTRYEGWALVVSGCVFVLAVSLRRGSGVRRSVVLASCFATPPALAVVWWLSYNTAVYGNPLEFLTGQYSASQYNKVYADTGRLTTAGNPGLSIKVLGDGMLENIGLAGLVVAGLGLLLMTWRWGLDYRAMVVWLGGTSSAFLLYSLIGGQQVILNDASLPVGAYNNRNVLSALPWVALLCAVLVGLLTQGGGRPDGPRWRRATRWLLTGALVGGVALALVVQNLWWAADPIERMSVITEAHGQKLDYVEVKQMGRWLGEHYDGGGILLDESSILVTPIIGLDQEVYVNRATGPLFETALADPYTHARWVFMHADADYYVSNASSLDQVTLALADDPGFLSRYQLVRRSPRYVIYRRVGDPS